VAAGRNGGRNQVQPTAQIRTFWRGKLAFLNMNSSCIYLLEHASENINFMDIGAAHISMKIYALRLPHAQKIDTTTVHIQKGKLTTPKSSYLRSGLHLVLPPLRPAAHPFKN